MTRNAECSGHPHSTRLGCGWKGERFPNVPMYWPRPWTNGMLVLSEKYIDAIATKACPKCGGIVMPIAKDDVL